MEHFLKDTLPSLLKSGLVREGSFCFLLLLIKSLGLKGQFQTRKEIFITTLGTVPTVVLIFPHSFNHNLQLWNISQKMVPAYQLFPEDARSFSIVMFSILINVSNNITGFSISKHSLRTTTAVFWAAKVDQLVRKKAAQDSPPLKKYHVGRSHLVTLHVTFFS